MVQQLRVAARVLALAGYGLCYSLAGALFAWVSFLFVALWSEWKVGDVSSYWEAGSILAGFLVAACLAWRAERNTLAHFWVMALGITQATAGGLYAIAAVFDRDRSMEDWLLVGWRAGSVPLRRLQRWAALVDWSPMRSGTRPGPRLQWAKKLTTVA